MIKNKIKKLSLIGTFLATTLIPSLVLSIDYNPKDKTTKNSYKNKEISHLSKMLLYDNKIFNNNDEVLNYYLMKNPEVIDNKNVIGDVQKSIIDFDYNILNQRQLKEFNPKLLSPVYTSAAREKTKDFNFARKSKINPAFTTQNYTDGFNNFFDYKNIAKNSFSKHLVQGKIGLQNIDLLDGKKSFYNPLSANDYSSYYINALKSLQKYQKNKLNLPNYYQRQYFNKNDEQILSFNQIFQNQSLANLFSEEENKEFDHYLQMKNVKNAVNNYNLEVKNIISNVNSNVAINLNDYNLKLTSLTNDVIQAKNQYIVNLLEDRKRKQEQVKKISQEIHNLEDNKRYFQDRINNSLYKNLERYDIKNLTGQNKYNLRKKIYGWHYIENGSVAKTGSERTFYSIFLSNQNGTKDRGFHENDHDDDSEVKRSNISYPFKYPLNITKLNDIKMYFSWSDKDYYSPSVNYFDSKHARFTEYFSEMKKLANQKAQNVVNNYLNKYNETKVGSIIVKTFLNSINIGKVKFKTYDDYGYDDTHTDSIRFQDLTFDWSYTVDFKSKSNNTLNEISSLQKQIDIKNFQIKNLNNKIYNINKEISKKNIYIEKLGLPKVFKEFNDINSASSINNFYKSSLNGIINKNKFSLSYNQFKKIVENDQNSNKNIIKSQIGNDNALWLWLRNKRNLNQEALYSVDLKNIINNDVFTLMDSIDDKNNLEIIFDFTDLKFSNRNIYNIKVYWKLKKQYPKFKNYTSPPQKLNFNQIKKLDINKDYLFFKIQSKIKEFNNPYESNSRLDPLKSFLNNYSKNISEVITYKQLPVLKVIRNSKLNIKNIVPFSQNKSKLEIKKLLSIFPNMESLYNQYKNKNLEEFKETLKISNFKNNIQPGLETAAYNYFTTLKDYINQTSIIGKLPNSLSFKLPEKIDNFSLFKNSPVIIKKYWVLNQYIFNGSTLSKVGIDHIDSTNIYEANSKQQETLMQEAKEKYTKYFNPPLVSHLYDANGKEVAADNGGYSMYDSLEIIIENARLGVMPDRDLNSVFYGSMNRTIKNFVSNIYILNYEEKVYYFINYNSLKEYLKSKLMEHIKTYVREEV